MHNPFRRRWTIRALDFRREPPQVLNPNLQRPKFWTHLSALDYAVSSNQHMRSQIGDEKYIFYEPVRIDG